MREQKISGVPSQHKNRLPLHCCTAQIKLFEVSYYFSIQTMILKLDLQL